MFENIPLLKASGLMAKHASLRQRVISENIANSDTPNYAPRDIPKFGDVVRSQAFSNFGETRREGHFDFTELNKSYEAVEGKDFEVKPNGNSVSIEIEVTKSIEVERQHSQALAIYQHSIDLLKSSIGRGR